MARKDADMTSGSILKQLVSFAVPMAIGLIFQQLYNTVDTLVVGRFVSKEALAAVGSVANIINMLVGLCSGIATGAGVIISQHYGAQNAKRLHDAVHTTIALTFILSIAATLIGLVLVEPMLSMMQTPADVWSESRTYLQIYFAGISGLLIYNMGSGILRAVGDSKRPLYFLIFSAAINTAGDLIFVLVFRMGVAGVAYATILAQMLSALMILFVLNREHGGYGFMWSHLKVDGMELKHILSVGLPSGVQQALTAFSNVFVQSYINAFGSDCMAGYSSYGKLDAFVLVPVMSISMASTTFVGQNWGARKLSRARKGVSTALILSLSSTLVLTVVMLLFATPLMKIFNEDPDVVDYGIRFLRIITPFYLTVCFNQIYGGVLRGIGNAKGPMIIMFSSFVVFRQIYLFITSQLHAGFVAVALAYPMGWIVCSLLLFIAYRRSRLCRPDPIVEAARVA